MATHRLLTSSAIATFLVSGIIVGSAFVTFSTVFAQTSRFSEGSAGTNEQVSLTAIPPRVGEDNSILVKPGEKRQVTIRVSNSSPQSTAIRTTAQDFIVESDEGTTPIPINVAEADNRWSLASWLTISPAAQTIRPNQSGQIEVLIEVPEDALPGGHYAMITHQPDLAGINENTLNDQRAQVSAINQRVGTLLYVVVEGPINEEAFIREFTVPEFSEFGPVPFSFILENGSDVHIRPQIGVEIKNFFGKTIATIQPETQNIFPFTSRKFSGEWNRIWGFGRYTAEAVVSYGSSGNIVTAKVAFWLIPIKLIIAILVVILLIILAGMSIRRHMLHRKQDQSKKIVELETKLQQLQNEKMKKFEE